MPKFLLQGCRLLFGKVMGSNQYAFILGCQILDAALVANECIDSFIKTENSGILCKFDIGKAYDHVSWSFLLAIIEKMGFARKCRNWISFCISTVCFSILINGEASGYSRGLRQGDPLSLYCSFWSLRLLVSW